MRKIVNIVVVFLIPFFYLLPFKGHAEELDRGKIINKIYCRDNNEYSYALFLPSVYSKEKKWPIIFGLDPGARGRIPVEKFKAAAEKYGYIVVGSNNARNGPWKDFVLSVQVTWADIQGRFQVDPDRIYATGFSGGARGAVVFPFAVKKKLAGIIACGAGLPGRFKPEQVKPAAYIGIIGLFDFNYNEMSKLDLEFDGSGVIHRILIFEWGHGWPPEEICMDAVEWMELIAIKRKTKEMDNKFIEYLYLKRLKQGEEIEKAGKLVYAADEYHQILHEFKDYKDVGFLEKKINRLKNTNEYKVLLKKKKEIGQKESNYRWRFIETFNKIEKSLKKLSKPDVVISELKIESLLKESVDDDDIYEKAMAKRLLFDLVFKADQSGEKALKKGMFQKAIVYFEVLKKASKEHPNSFYKLACVYSLLKEGKKALKNLKLAVEKGFDDYEYIMNDKRLEFVKKTGKFKAIVNALKSEN